MGDAGRIGIGGGADDADRARPGGIRGMSGRPVPAVAAVALLVAAPAAAVPATLESAMAFGEQLYHYLPEHGGRDAPYAPKLRGLIARDAARAAAAGAPPTLPLCDCTAFARHYHLTKLRVRSARAGRVTLFATFDNDGPQAFRLDLLRQGDGWTIADVHGPRTPSLLARLERAAATRGAP